MPDKKYLIFTDMDGSLLDHDTYSHLPADATLTELKARRVPIIPNTSKTYPELLQLNQELGLTSPFIVENGAAVFIPIGYFAEPPAEAVEFEGYWVKEFTQLRAHWIEVLNQAGQSFESLYEHFADMSIQRICESTGLSPEQAALAAERHFSEPVLWHGDEAQRLAFINALEDAGAEPLTGGRFIHVSGNCNKGRALNWLTAEYQRQRGGEFCTLAIGDSHNDVAMLEVADVAIRILSPHKAPPELKRTHNIITSTLPGPQGWSETVEQILAQYF